VPDVEDGVSVADTIADRADFGRQLTALRERAGLTVRQVAGRANAPGSHSTLGDWFAGRGLPSTSSQQLFLDTLRVCGITTQPEVDAWLLAWRRVRRAPGPRVFTTEPYRGLASYQPDDAEWFFGRGPLVDALLGRLEAHHRAGGGIEIVVGASGSGKSSLLRAGLIPALRAGRLAGSSEWTIHLGTPGEDPVATLAGLAAPDSGDRLVVVVDQFEELFTACADDSRRAGFLARLEELAQAGALVVLGLRADFYAQALRFPQLVRAAQDSQLTVGPMTEAQLREVIVGPARKAKVDLEDGLVELLLRDVAPAAGRDPERSGAGALPLLSHALYSTWSHAPDKRLTIAGYRAVGGLDGAVAASADEVYQGLDQAQRELARRLFLTLVHAGTDAADTRRRVPLGQLLDRFGAAQRERVRTLLDLFVAQRLLTVDTDSVQISHEALIHAWPTLRGWLDHDRAGLLVGQQLNVAAEGWGGDRDTAALYRGTRLAAASEWAGAHEPDLPPLTREFLAASTRQARRQTHALYRTIGVMAALLVLTVALAGYAFQQRGAAAAQRHEAVTARDEAISRLVAGRADRLRTSDPALAMQLSLVAFRVAPTAEARSSLLDAPVGPAVTRLLGFTNAVQAVVFSPDRRLLAATGLDGRVRLWDTGGDAMPVLVATLDGSPKGLFALAFSPDGRLLAAGGTDHSVHLWDMADPRHPRRFDVTLDGPASTVYGIAFSPDGAVLAAASDDGSVWRWDLTDAARPQRLAQLTTAPATPVRAVAFSPDGRLLAAARNDGTVDLWSADPHAATLVGAPIRASEVRVLAVAFSPDGAGLAAGGTDGRVRRWGLADPAHPVPLGQPLVGPTSWVNSLAFSPDGTALTAGCSDNSVTSWNLASGEVIALLPHPAPVTAVSYGRDGHTLATGSTDGVVRRWVLPGPVLAGHTDAIFNAAFSPDGHTLVTAGRDRTVRLWDVNQPRAPRPIGGPLTSPEGQPPFAGTVAASPDGHTVAAGTREGQVQVWDGRPPHVVRVLSGPTALVEGVTFSPDGRLLAAADDDGSVYLWDLTADGDAALATLPNPGGLILSATFSPDGRTLAAASTDGTARLWSVADPAHPVALGEPLGGFSGYVYSAAFSPDGHTLAVGSADKSVRLWDVTDPAHPSPLGPALTGPTSYVYWVAFSPDGATLAAAVTDASVWLWRVPDRRHPQPAAVLTRASNALYVLAFGPDGTLAAAGSDRQIRLWDLDTARVGRWICATVGAAITPQEWSQYVPGVPYQPPCR
jgi:WD40 repeat protein/transcriptional regulator with XRE-family HTH domain